MPKTAAVALFAACLSLANYCAPAETPAKAPAQTSVHSPTINQTPTPETNVALDNEGGDSELLTQPVSNAARIRLDRARDSVVQILGFFGDSKSEAFHGSGFAANDNGLIVTNYHVVAEAVLYPKQYRLEYLAFDGSTGLLRVYAVDVEHDLAIVKTAGFTPPPLKLRTQIPNKGERAYSIGFPLSLGLTITEGVANGLVESSLEQRIYYSGAMNGGMSGGPALDASGAVYGVNVSVFTGKQSVSFVVPAKHIAPLLARAAQPIKAAAAREQVATQLFAHQASVFATVPAQIATQKSSSFTLPDKFAPNVECNSDGSADPSKSLQIEAIGCAARVGVYVERGLEMGDLRFRHRLLESDKLNALQFADRVNRVMATPSWYGSDKYVAAFTCSDAIVALNGFDAKVVTCVRQYRMFASLYDIGLTVASVHQSQRAVVSSLELRGVAFEPGLDFVRRYLESMKWNP